MAQINADIVLWVRIWHRLEQNVCLLDVRAPKVFLQQDNIVRQLARDVRNVKEYSHLWEQNVLTVGVKTVFKRIRAVPMDRIVHLVILDTH